MACKKRVLIHFETISLNVISPAVAPNSETTPAEFMDAAINDFSIFLSNIYKAAQKVEAKASPAPRVEVIGPSKQGQ